MQYVSKQKSTICQEIGVDVLIDHQVEHVLACAKIGVDVLLYDRQARYRWNHHGLLSSDTMNRVTTWKDIIRQYFPKPNSPLRHLVYSSAQQEDLYLDDEEEAILGYDDFCYHQQLDQDGNEIILIEEGEDEDDSQRPGYYGYEVHQMEDWSIVV
jgi:hypothetical protein